MTRRHSSEADPVAPPTSGGAVPTQHASYDPGYGWVLFAGVLLMVVATIDLIQGLAAIGNSAFFVRNAHYVIGSLNTWGWVVTVIGTLGFLAGFGILVKNQVARWMGVGLLALDIVIQLLLLPADPAWSLTIIALNSLGLYALLVHGRLLSPE